MCARLLAALVTTVKLLKVIDAVRPSSRSLGCGFGVRIESTVGVRVRLGVWGRARVNLEGWMVGVGVGVRVRVWCRVTKNVSGTLCVASLRATLTMHQCVRHTVGHLISHLLVTVVTVPLTPCHSLCQSSCSSQCQATVSITMSVLVLHAATSHDAYHSVNHHPPSPLPQHSPPPPS